MSHKKCKHILVPKKKIIKTVFNGKQIGCQVLYFFL
jgi:hypothetical protein